MPHILIIGQKFSSLTDYLTAHGHTYTLLQDVLRTKFPDKKFKNRIVADFSNADALIASLALLKTSADAVMTTYENYVLPTAIIAQHLGLPGMPIQAAEACTDKFLMRSLFDTASEKISPAFATVSSEDDVRDFASSHEFPLILKPANLAKSLLVTKNSSLEELLHNYHKSIGLLQTTYKKYAPNRTPQLIIEEFLEGSIHSVDAFVDADGTPHILDAVVDYQTGYDIGYDDNFHYSRLLPSTLTAADQTALKHVASLGVKALGMRSSAAHIEIIMTTAGPRIVEIGARNGGYRERMHAIANGIDITANALAVALNQPLDIAPHYAQSCAVIELFPKTPGNYAGISNESTLRSLASLTYFSEKASQGSFVGKSADGYKMCAVLILHNENAEQFAKDLAYVNQHVAALTNN